MNLDYQKKEVYKSGALYMVSYYDLKGNLHREDEPAETKYYSNGIVERETYYRKGKRHNKNGAADIYYDEYGNVTYKYYYIKGQRYDQFEHSVIAATLRK